MDAFGHTDVERAGAAGHDVDKVLVILNEEPHSRPHRKNALQQSPFVLPALPGSFASLRMTEIGSTLISTTSIFVLSCPKLGVT